MHPYESLDSKCFWSSAVAKRNMFDISDLWDPKFRISNKMKVATFGSCFAEHIGKALHIRGFNWLISEPAPLGLSTALARKYNYGIFSARTGNIYTVSLLKQWVEWAIENKPVPNEVWEKDGRFYDPFRPNIEPDGFETKDEMIRSRNATIKAFRTTLVESNVFVFTLGLTESWFNSEQGYEYPICPGTVAGTYDPRKHQFVNQDFPFIRKALMETILIIKELNPNIKFILTVSPVPLTATMSGNHVLVATMESKSVLRAVAGSLRRRFKFVDYFPSYEIINATPYRGTFFESNQRNVNPAGVDHVMNLFFFSLSSKFPVAEGVNAGVTSSKSQPTLQPNLKTETNNPEDVVCEEELLNSFSNGA